MTTFLAADPVEHVLPHPLFGDHLTWFTNQSLMALVAGVLMLLIFPRLYSKPDSSAPKGAKNFFESILEYLRLEVFRPALKSMIATLASMVAERRILVAGEMLELGLESIPLHRECGKVAAEKGIDLIVGVRGHAQYLVDAARDAGALAIFLPSVPEAGVWLKAELRAGDAVLLKASRGVGLEQALRVLQEP